MNRIIKFRGYSTFSENWYYGAYIKVGNEVFICSDGDMEVDGHHIRQCVDAPLWVEPDSIGQFTGLYDMHGTEIYEGDILQLGNSDDLDYLEVRFVRGVFAFLWKGNLDKEFPTQVPTHEWAEVVGNIYKNPEILKNRK